MSVLELDESREQKDRDGCGLGDIQPHFWQCPFVLYDFGGALAIQLIVGSSQKATDKTAKQPKTVKFAYLPTCPQFSNSGGVSQKWGWIPQVIVGEEVKEDGKDKAANVRECYGWRRVMEVVK